MSDLSPLSLASSLPGDEKKIDAKTAKAKSSAIDFESVFLTQILNSMSEGLGQDTGFDGGSGEAQWRSMLNEFMARSISGSGGIIAPDVTQELLKLQEV